MENATDALKMAFAVLVFTMALSISVFMFSQLNEVSKSMIASTDSTAYYQYIRTDKNSKNYRIVGLETIIPTLYKYYKENYTVLFLDKSGNPLNLYQTQMNKPELWGSGIPDGTTQNPNVQNIAKYYVLDGSSYQAYANNITKPVCTFDVDEETVRHEPWTGTHEDFKKNLDAFLRGGKFIYPNGSGDAYDYGRGFIDRCQTYNYKFREMLGEYTYNLFTDEDDEENNARKENELLKAKKKRVIVYQID